MLKNLVIKNILSKTYVLDHSGSLDMHIGKFKKKILFFGGVRKKTFFCRTGGGGGGSEFMDMSTNYRVLFYDFRLRND